MEPRALEPRISLVTLGVADLVRARDFYQRVVGWTPAFVSPQIVFFDLGGVAFSVYPHAELAADMNAAPPDDAPPLPAYRGCALAHNLRSEAEVDAAFARLRERGAQIVKPPQKAAWGGYSGYFADPDGHRWELAHNPYWTLTADGRVSMTPS